MIFQKPFCSEVRKFIKLLPPFSACSLYLRFSPPDGAPAAMSLPRAQGLPWYLAASLPLQDICFAVLGKGTLSAQARGWG